MPIDAGYIVASTLYIDAGYLSFILLYISFLSSFPQLSSFHNISISLPIFISLAISTISVSINISLIYLHISENENNSRSGSAANNSVHFDIDIEIAVLDGNRNILKLKTAAKITDKRTAIASDTREPRDLGIRKSKEDYNFRVAFLETIESGGPC